MPLSYKIVLSLHIISVISWMAGLLYLYRLLIYRTEETNPEFQKKLETMAERLFRIITAPAMVASFIFGILMLTLQPGLLTQIWMHIKLLCVLGMVGFSVYAARIREQLANGETPLSSRTLRILNEMPTVLMILIVFFVILKPFS